MSKATGLTREQLYDMYFVKHLTYAEIGKAFGVTRACICKTMKRFGLEVANGGERFNAVCDYCGKEYSITRARFNNQRAHYCSDDCYYGHKASILPLRTENRHGKRVARAVMEKHLGRPLIGSECIHHIDGNQLNNDVSNLILFASHSEHLRFHHQMRIAKAEQERG